MYHLQALKDVDLQERPMLQNILHYTDRAFTVIFVAEISIKLLALGLWKYFSNAWLWIDFVVVMVSQDLISCQYQLKVFTYASRDPSSASSPHFVVSVVFNLS